MGIDVTRAVGPDGWATSGELLTRVSPRTLGSWVADGKVVRLRPGVFALPGAAGHWRTRVAAALEGREAVASHATALALWELAAHPPGPVHLSVDSRLSGRGSPGELVHRVPDPCRDVRRVAGLAVTSPARAVVDTWGSPGPFRRPVVRAAAIEAVRQRLSSPRDLGDELARRPRVPGRRGLARLVDLLADGCRSELEVWGCLHVLRAPGMPVFVQQRPIGVGGRTFHLDAAYEEAMLVVELDGAAWHGSRAQRERDISRDALLATVGWQTLRSSYARLTSAPDTCRRELLAVHAASLGLLHRVR